MFIKICPLETEMNPVYANGLNKDFVQFVLRVRDEDDFQRGGGGCVSGT